MTLKQDLIARIFREAGQQVAALEAATGALEAAEFLATRLQASGDGPAHAWNPIATPHLEHVSIALINYGFITAEDAAAAAPAHTGYSTAHSLAYDLAGYPFQAIVSNPVGALLKAA